MKKYLITSLIVASLGWGVNALAQTTPVQKEKAEERMEAQGYPTGESKRTERREERMEARMQEMRDFNAFRASFVNFSSRVEGASPLLVSIHAVNGTFVKCVGECSQLNPNGIMNLFIGTRNPNEMPAADVTFRYRIRNIGCPDGYMYGVAMYHVVSNTYRPIKVFYPGQDIRPNTVQRGLSCSPQ